MKIKTIKIKSVKGEIVYFGLISQIKPYVLIWKITNKLKFRFKAADFNVRLQLFPKYTYLSENFKEISIYVNRIEGRIAFKELKNINYILKFEGDFSKEEIKTIARQLRRIEGILGISPIAFNRLRKDKRKIQRVS